MKSVFFTFRLLGLVVVFGLFLSFLTGCGAKGSATLEFTNDIRSFPVVDFMKSSILEDLVPNRAATPSVFGMKLIAVYLSEDIDPITLNNSGNTEMIYLNPDCNEDISNCDLSGATHTVNSYFNFAQSTSAVNAELNAQAREVGTGDYKYVRVEFCKYNPGGAHNIQFQATGMGATHQYRNNGCVVNSAEASPPITVTADQAVTVSLAYTITNAVDGPSAGTGDNCDGSGYCLTLPTFTPSVSAR